MNRERKSRKMRLNNSVDASAMIVSVETVEQRIARRFAVYPHRGVDKVIGEEVKRQGYCDLSQREIARRADVNMRTVDRRLDSLADAGMISITPRTGALGQSITNKVIITSSTWLALLNVAKSDR